MAVGAFTIFTKNLNFLNPAALAAGTIKCALVTSSYTPDFTSSGNSIWANASSNEIANGNGYTTGGAIVGSMAVTAITGGFKFASATVTWTASGGSIPAWRRAVFYNSGSLGGLTNPLIGAFLGDATPADVPATTTGNALSLNCPSAGWFPITA